MTTPTGPTVLDSRDLVAAVGSTFTADHAITVDLDLVRRFGRMTGADHWMHTDPERAAATALGRPTVQGMLTVSLGAELAKHVLDIRCADAVFHGIDRLRFPAPMFVGDPLRLEIEVVAVDDLDDAVRARLRHVFHSSAAKPVCVHDNIVRYQHT